jgi:N-methylhydantoinase B
MEISNKEPAPFVMSSMFDRVGHPPRGRDGGANGMTGRVYTTGGAELKAKGRQRVAAGDRLVLEMPGGGGYGDPKTRDPAQVALDVRDGLVSPEMAREAFGVMLAADGSVDQAATARARAA